MEQNLKTAKKYATKLWNTKKIHAAKAYRNRANLNYIHPLCFYQKSLTDPSNR